ncbi:MAG: ATP-binding protein [Gammaproteobacteria bacterium]|nr:ATP-binding protein [Gammaproteobacteria bacterium]
MKLLYESAVRDESGLVLLRSRFKAVGRRKGFREVMLEKIELVCNEIVSNQIKHARGSGMIQIWDNESYQQPTLDIFALDYGPGIEDLEYAIQDGTTTTGTMGRGLGAIQRLSTESAFYTRTVDELDRECWHGTAVWSRFVEGKQKQSSGFQYGIYSRALRDDFFNGDGVQIRNDNTRLRWIHMDGLGHGKEAAEAICPARNVLDADEDNLESVMQHLGRVFQSGRGAVAVVGELDASEERLSITGVGDMSAKLICNGELNTMALAAGVLGHSHRSVNIEHIHFPRQAVFISASDGIRKWSLNTLPQLWRHHPQMIALVMGQILGRTNDDRSILVIRKSPTN